MTLQARDVVVQGDALSDAKAADARPAPGDDPGDFMAKYAGWGHGARLDLLHVGRAHAANGYAHQEFTRSDVRNRNGFDPEIIDPMVNNSAHRFWNRVDHRPGITGNTQAGEALKPHILQAGAAGTEDCVGFGASHLSELFARA
jgi:hypothetical protein